MISLDTTRADGLSCYGGEGARTPNLDALAARGLRFATALSQAPTTLASHTALFSGLDTHKSGVARNGTPPDEKLPLLAERLAAAGWDTQAVIGASVLNARQGLSRGFRVYDDDVGEARVRKRFEDDAPGVTERALAAVDARQPGKPLFLFVHYFDVHMPWTSAPRALQDELLGPAPRVVTPRSKAMKQIFAIGRAGKLTDEHRRQMRALYLAEVVWVDQHVGALLDGLEARGALSESLVVVFADHGESLGEPSASHVFGHGADVDGPNLHVPLILAGRGALSVPTAIVERQVRLMDVGPTLLGLLGLEPKLGEGEDLRPLWTSPESAPPAPPSYAEASKPLEHERTDAWNNLDFERSVAEDGHLWVRTPWRDDEARLVRLAPGFPEVQDPDRAATLDARLQAWDALAPPHRSGAVDAATSEMLEALGYLERDP